MSTTAITTQLRGATAAQLGELARLEWRYGPLVAYLQGQRVAVAVYGQSPLTLAGQPLPWLTLTLLPSGRATDALRHDYAQEFAQHELDAAVLDATRRDPSRKLSIKEIGKLVDAADKDVRDSLQRLIAFGSVKREVRRYSTTEGVPA